MAKPVPVEIGGGVYARFVPKGGSLFGRTSEGSGSALPKGYVFAYEDINEVFGDWSPYAAHEEPAGMEVVLFEGRGEFAPGDAEGVAVKPTREIARAGALDWLQQVAERHPDANVRANAGPYSERWKSKSSVQRPTQIGKRGGIYYISASGKKVYLRKG